MCNPSPQASVVHVRLWECPLGHSNSACAVWSWVPPPRAEPSRVKGGTRRWKTTRKTKTISTLVIRLLLSRKYLWCLSTPPMYKIHQAKSFSQDFMPPKKKNLWGGKKISLFLMMRVITSPASLCPLTRMPSPAAEAVISTLPWSPFQNPISCFYFTHTHTHTHTHIHFVKMSQILFGEILTKDYSLDFYWFHLPSATNHTLENLRTILILG